MNIPVESIPKKDAIDEARRFMEQVERRDEELWHKGIIEVSLARGQYERIAKVLFVGIGELSK